MGSTIDAWEQRHHLMIEYTQEWEVRSDLKVTAQGCDRCVQLAVGLGVPHPKFPWMQKFHYTQRNVDTMRELAGALLAACDLVEKANPTWAEASRQRDDR